MKALKALFEFYIDSSIHVALAICALAGVTVLSYDLDWDWPVFGFIFLASITGYNFVKYAGMAKLHHRSLTNQLKSIQLFSLVCFLGLIYLTTLQSWRFIIATASLGLFTFFYAVPFSPNRKNLRNLKSLKVFVIAFVWAGATLWLPLVDQRPLFSVDVLLKTLSYAVFVLALILPFEIRDLNFDSSKLGTLPQRLGIAKTKRLGYVLLVVFIFLTILAPSSTLSTILTDGGIALLVGVFIAFSSKGQADHYASFWVEAVPMIWFLIHLLLQP